MKLYHVSSNSNLNDKLIKPWIPYTASLHENREIARICVCKHPKQCCNAVLDVLCSHYKRIYLYSCEAEPYTPSITQVNDAKITHEKWVLNSIIMHLEDSMNIKIIPSGDNEYLLYHIAGDHHNFNLKTLNLFKFYGPNLDRKLYNNVQWRNK